jgi:hypothetical protein
VPTFVIGIPGTERYADYLNAFATAGGVPNPSTLPDYYAVSAEGGVDGLTRITVCPCTCARFQAGRVDVRLGCKPRLGLR